jgi:translation initiation factor IF-3
MKIAEALEAAKKQGLTLVEIAPLAKPPVAKIVDFGKFRYAEEKKLRKESKRAKATELKEVRFSPFIAENDFQTRFGRVKEFLADKNKVRLVVVFRGPQMRSKNFGYQLLDRMVKELGESIVTDMQPKFLGKHLMMIISPTTKRAVPTTKVVSEESESNHAKTENEKNNH